MSRIERGARHRAAAAAILLVLVAPPPALARRAPARPNIVWISAEDLSPDLGIYGDSFAATPTLDQLAREGARFTHAFSGAPVCAPSRSAIITGMYPTTIGSMHMRSNAVPPAGVKAFTEYLRAAGLTRMAPGRGRGATARN